MPSREFSRALRPSRQGHEHACYVPVRRSCLLAGQGNRLRLRLKILQRNTTLAPTGPSNIKPRDESVTMIHCSSRLERLLTAPKPCGILTEPPEACVVVAVPLVCTMMTSFPACAWRCDDPSSSTPVMIGDPSFASIEHLPGQVEIPDFHDEY